MEDFKTRLMAYARNAHDMGQTRFEEFCGINRGTINSIGPKGLGAAMISEILIKCPDLNARWLITGEGEMLERKPDADAKQAIYDLTIENLRLKKKIAELEGKGAAIAV